MRRTLYLAMTLWAVVPPLAAQDPEPPPMLDSARRAQLEEEIERRFGERVKQELDLTDDQSAKLRATHEKFRLRRRELMQRQRGLRFALDDQMRPGVAADPDSVRKLNEARAQNRVGIFELEQDQEREMGTYLSPVQVAQYRMMRERLIRRINDVRRDRARLGPGGGVRGRPGPAGRPRVQRRPGQRPR